MPSQGAPAAIPAPGEVLGGKYLIQRLIGEGGMAFVFEASHQRLAQRVALKLLHPDFARDAEIVARFEREARSLALLRSRHVARVSDVDATLDGLPYIVMEYLEGRDLDAELQERGRIPVDEAIDYVLQACAAMAEAHGAGIVHRDLKPANLFLAQDNGERIVKVLDFGISKVVGESTRLTGSGAVMGTVLYMSPEQVRATHDVDTRADIWALGMILYELVAGRAPWEGSSHQIAAAIVSTDAVDIRTFVPVPDGFATALHTALARDRNHRYASVRDLAAALVPFTSPSSLGAAIADQLVAGHSSPRMRPPFGASLPPASSPHPSLQMPAQGAVTALATPAGDDSRVRPFVAVGAVLGVLAAVGIVLGFVALGARHEAPVVADSPPPSAPIASLDREPEATAPVPSAPSTGLAEVAPTSSAGAGASATATATASARRPARAAGAAPTVTARTPPPASVPPPFL